MYRLWIFVAWLLAIVIIPVSMGLIFAVGMYYIGAERYAIEVFQTIVTLFTAFLGYLFMTNEDEYG